MSNLTLTQMCDAVRDDMSQAAVIKRAMSPADMKEGIPDLPLVQVYPESGQVSANSGTDRITFKAGVRDAEMILHIDAYARQRSHIGEDMAKVLEVADAIFLRLEAQNSKPYFGLIGIKAYKWSWQRVTFAYGDPQTSYSGIRFTLTLDMF